MEVFRTGLEKQAKEINAKAGKQVVFIVPAGEAVLALRAKVIAGEVPGITKQSELFRDPIGHGLEPLTRLVSYCNYAAIYRTSPVGLKVFEKDGDENARKLNRMLQEIAWKAVSEGDERCGSRQGEVAGFWLIRADPARTVARRLDPCRESRTLFHSVPGAMV